jgi:hypothetical protein
LRTAISLFCAPYEAFVRCQDENRDVVEFNLLFEKMSADKATAVTQIATYTVVTARQKS